MSVLIAPGVTDLHLPRIGWRAIDGTITASSEQEGFEADLAAKPQTYNAWKPDGIPRQWNIDAGEPVTVDYCGVGAHNLDEGGFSCRVFASSDGVNFDPITPTLQVSGPEAILFLFPPESFRYWRLGIFDGAGQPRIGNIRFGEVMKLPRKSVFSPSLPISEADQYTYNVNMSVTGEWLGRSVVSSGLEFRLTVENVSELFAAGEWADFRKHCNEGSAAFYVAPKPQAYPSEVAYAWPLETVRAERAIPNSAISRRVELQCGGYSKK